MMKGEGDDADGLVEVDAFALRHLLGMALKKRMLDFGLCFTLSFG